MKCVVSVQTLRAELLWAVAGVGHEDQGLQAQALRSRLAQRPKSISATRFSTFKTASKRLSQIHIESSANHDVIRPDDRASAYLSQPEPCG